MRIRIGVAVIAGMASIASGCFSMYQYRSDWERALRSRAAFEMSCPEEQLQITPLTDARFGITDAPLSQGVTGCGQKSVYVASESGYILNSTRTQ